MTSRQLSDAVWGGNNERIKEILLGSRGSIDLNEKFRLNEQTSLHAAVAKNNLKAVNWLLAAGAHVGVKDDCDRTPLHVACLYRASMDIIEVLIIAGSNLLLRDNFGHTPLFNACRIGYWQIIEFLLKHGASLTETDSTALHIVAEAEHHAAKTAEILLKNGAEMESRNKDGQTALNLASMCGNQEVAKLLLARGALYSSVNNDGDTPLHMACLYAHAKAVKLLVEKGAEVDAQNKESETSLHLVVSESDKEEKRTEIVRFLFGKGAAWNSKQSDGGTPFHMACLANNVEVVRVFLEQGAEIEVKDGDGDTPLLCACCDGSLEVVQELVSHGADWSFKSPTTGMTPFDVALDNDYPEIGEYLQQLYLDSLAQEGRQHPLHGILQDAKYTEEVEQEEENDDEDEDDESVGERGTVKKISIRLGSVTIDTFLSILASIVSSDPDSIRSQGQDRALPVHTACRTRAHIEVIQFLTSQDAATLHYSDNFGNLPIHAACGASASRNIMEHLIECGGPGLLCARDCNGALPLHLLCKSKPSVDVVQFLIRFYSRAVSSHTESGERPVMLAINHEASEDVIFELLKANPGALAYMKSFFGTHSV